MNRVIEVREHECKKFYDLVVWADLVEVDDLGWSDRGVRGLGSTGTL